MGEDSDNLVLGSLFGEEPSVVSPAVLSSLSPLVSSLSSFLNLVLTLISNSRPLSGLSGSSPAPSSETFVMLLASLSRTALSLFLLLSFPAGKEKCEEKQKYFSDFYLAKGALNADQILPDVANTCLEFVPRDFRFPLCY